MIEKSRLFTHQANLEIVEWRQKRPLAELSDFVVDELPEVLTEIRHGNESVDTLTYHADSLISAMDQDLVMGLIEQKGVHGLGGYYPFSHDRDLAGLDVKMLEAGVIHSGGIPSPRLSEAVSLFAESNNQPGVITYEEIIMGDVYGNPPTDPRLFTSGEVARAETDFYRGHAHIDKNVRSIINQVTYAKFAIDMKGKDGIDKAAQELARATKFTDATLSDLDAFRSNLNPDDFNIFRQYLGTHPVRELKGPSGAFTDTVPILDLELAGEMMSDTYKQYLKDNIVYFPRKGRREILRAIQESEQGNSLMRLYNQVGQPSELREPIKDLLDFVRSFRGRHYNAVKTQVPGALSGDLAGTGGEIHPKQFLLDRIKETKTIRDNLTHE